MLNETYRKILAYGVMPMLAFSYLTYFLINTVVEHDASYETVLTSLLAIGLYIAASIALAKDKGTAYMLLQLAITSSVLKIIVKEINEKSNGVESVSNPFLAGLSASLIFVVWLVVNNRLSSKRLKSGKVFGKENNGKNLNQELTIRKVSVFKDVLSCILMTVVMITFALIIISLQSEWNQILYSFIAGEKKLSILAEQNLHTVINSAVTFCEAGFALWVSTAFFKSGLVSKKYQGFESGRKPLPAIAYGMLAAIVVVFGASIVIYAYHSKLVVNHLSKRDITHMILGALAYVGVGIYEEVVSRGIVLGYCEKKNLKIFGVVLSTVFFVSVHFLSGAYNRNTQALFLTATALLYCAVKFYENSIWECIGFHVMYNWMVTHFVELTVFGERKSVISIMNLTYTKQAIAICIPSIVLAIVFFYAEIAKAKNPDASPYDANENFR